MEKRWERLQAFSDLLAHDLPGDGERFWCDHSWQHVLAIDAVPSDLSVCGACLMGRVDWEERAQ